ncbi:MAG: hypothetical protein H6719_06890 [Sandaracinaceae bacterium]|nr:hypothetical protein [Sandaracinaceae bacterium]
MFDDFGGRDALPGWTQAWVYGFSPYIVALLLGAVLVVGAARASSPRSLATVVALGVALLAVTVGGAMSAFYLPMFLTVP